MEVEFAFLADRIELDEQRKRNVYGAGLTQFLAPVFPASINAVFVIGFKVHPHECDKEHIFDIDCMMSGDDTSGYSLKVGLNFTKSPYNPKADVVGVSHVGIKDMPVLEPGIYYFRVKTHTGRVLKRIQVAVYPLEEGYSPSGETVLSA